MRHPHGLRAAAGGDVGIPIGSAYEGGFFAGYISHTADGVATHGLIVSPKSSGEAARQVKTSDTSTPGTSSRYDGAANTAAMLDGSHPGASFCDGLTVGGYSDWYMPAIDELDIAYFNLKPKSTANDTTTTNDYSVPRRTSVYSSSVPGQTTVTAFQDGNSEAFVTNPGTTYDVGIWSSTAAPGGLAGLYLYFISGSKTGLPKSFSADGGYYVRAFRKFAI